MRIPCWPAYSILHEARCNPFWMRLFGSQWVKAMKIDSFWLTTWCENVNNWIVKGSFCVPGIDFKNLPQEPRGLSLSLPPLSISICISIYLSIYLSLPLSLSIPISLYLSLSLLIRKQNRLSPGSWMLLKTFVLKLWFFCFMIVCTHILLTCKPSMKRLV
jgi:hypothetical protein